jgi:DNA polymerase-1
MRADLVGVCLATEPGLACYIPLTHKSGAGEGLFADDTLAEGRCRRQRRWRC